MPADTPSPSVAWPLFEAYLVVDWSAASVPRRGRDSIWYAGVLRDGGRQRLDTLDNPVTRDAAIRDIGAYLVRLLEGGRRILIGFDFPFGYPAGTAARLRLPVSGGSAPWRSLWETLAREIEDDARNANNRFAVAEALNRRYGEPFPFWGNAPGPDRPWLLRRGRRPHRTDDVAERRLCDCRVRTVQPVWKLWGNGAVGGQALTGIPRVRQLRLDSRLAPVSRIWPFETGLRDDPHARIVLAEVYPSLIPCRPLRGMPKDAAQVTTMARHFARLDMQGRLWVLFSGDPSLDASARRQVETEEAWILGVAGAAFAPRQSPMRDRRLTA